MAYQLVAEVLDHAPPMTLAERLLLVAIAEAARVTSRECDIDTETLTRRVGVCARNIRQASAQLAERGINIRVPLGEDKNGNPVYAWRGRVPRYRLPAFAAPKDCPCSTCFAVSAQQNAAEREEKGGRLRPPSVQEGGRRRSEGGRQGYLRRTPASPLTVSVPVGPPSGPLRVTVSSDDASPDGATPNDENQKHAEARAALAALRAKLPPGKSFSRWGKRHAAEPCAVPGGHSGTEMRDATGAAA